MSGSLTALYLQNPQMANALRRQREGSQLRQMGLDSSPILSPWQGVARVAQALLGGYEEGQADKEIKGAAEAQQKAIAEALGPMPQFMPQAPQEAPPMAAPRAPVAQRALAPAEYGPIIAQAAKDTGIPEQLLTGLFAQESGFRPDARNPRSTATGIGQVLDSTAAQPGYGLPPLSPEARLDPAQAIPWSARYLAARAQGLGVNDWQNPQQVERALRAYGENTPEYARAVMQRAGMGGETVPTAAPPQQPQQGADERAFYLQQAEDAERKAGAVGQSSPIAAQILLQRAGMYRQFAMRAAPQPNDTERLLLASGLQPGTDEYRQMARALLDAKVRGPSTNVTVSGGMTLPTQPPAGWRYVRRPIEGGGESMTMEVIPGGPADIAQKEKEQKEGMRAEGAQRSGAIVIEDIGRIQDLVKNSNLPTTGMGATFLSNIPGTGASDVNKLLEGLRANISFDRLNQMRQESATGGALGNVTVRELELLAATYGSLEQSQSKEQFMTNLRRLRTVYMDIIHGKGKWEETEPPEAPPAPPPGFVPVPGR